MVEKRAVKRTVLSPDQVRSVGLPTAMPLKLSTVNATAWTWIGKRSAAAVRERRAREKNMMSECDGDCKEPVGFGSIDAELRDALIRARVEDAAMVCCRECIECVYWRGMGCG